MSFFPFTEGSDYRFSSIFTNTLPAEWLLNIEDDDIALEYDDQLILVYSPHPSTMIDRFEESNQFVRYNTSVHIVDNESKPYMHNVLFYQQQYAGKHGRWHTRVHQGLGPHFYPRTIKCPRCGT